MTVFITLIFIRLEKFSFDRVCKDPFFITERIGSLILTVFFLLMGITLKKAIISQPRITHYDQRIKI